MAIRIIYPDDGDRERRSAFTNRLIPESPYRSAGVPIPECRKIAKGLGSDDIELVYIEDVIIKGIVIFSSHEPFEKKKERIESFLPLLVSWMVTDIVSSSLWYCRDEKSEAEAYFTSLLDRQDEMTRRLGIVALMNSDFMRQDSVCGMLERLAGMHTDHYLLSMAIAWYYATAYTRFSDLAYPYFGHLDLPIRKMARQKCRDSRRIGAADKARLDIFFR